MGLEGGHQGVAHLVVGHQLLLLRGDDGVLPLGPGDDGLHALLQVGLGDRLPSLPHRPQGTLVDNIGQLCAGGAGGGPGNGLPVHVGVHMDVLAVDLQNGYTALEVGQLHRHPAGQTGQAA